MNAYSLWLSATTTGLCQLYTCKTTVEYRPVLIAGFRI